MRSILILLASVMLLSSCGGGCCGGGIPRSSSTTTTLTNLTALTVNGSINSRENIPTISVTICPPGSTSSTATGCATITDILVDTGSYGLRIFASEMPANYLNANPLATLNGEVLAQCTGFADGTYIVGTVRTV
jgi:hypothetical protein